MNYTDTSLPAFRPADCFATTADRASQDAVPTRRGKPSRETEPGTLPMLPAHIARMATSSQRAIAALEQRLGGMVVALWQSVHEGLDGEAAEALRRVLLGSQAPTIHLCLTSLGGDAHAAQAVVHQLRACCRRLVVHVPVQATSAATMICLGADEIRLGPAAYLSPTDGTFTWRDSPPINEVEFARLRARPEPGKPHRPGTSDGYEHLFAHMPPLVVAHMLRSVPLSERLCDDLLSTWCPPARRKRIIRTLVHSYPDHRCRIFQAEARRIGLPAVTMPTAEYAAVLALHDLHLSFGRVRRIPYTPLRWRETTMRTIIGSSARTVALVVDGENAREKLSEPWQDVWRNNGWRSLEAGGACPRIAVELAR